MYEPGAESGPERQTVVTGVGLGEVREPAAGAEVEGAAVDDRATDRCAVSADELREAVHHDVGAPLERADEVGRRDGVVDDQRDAVRMGDLAHPFDVEHVVLRVREHLAVERLRVRPDGRGPLLEIVRIVDEADLDAHLGQRVVEQVVGPPVQRRAGDDVVAGFGKGEDRDRLGRLARSDHQRSGKADGRGDTALQARQARLERALRGVHDAGVDVADLSEREEVLGVGRITELEARGLVDRHGAGTGGRVRLAAHMDLTGLETPLLRHLSSPLVVLPSFWRRVGGATLLVQFPTEQVGITACRKTKLVAHRCGFRNDARPERIGVG